MFTKKKIVLEGFEFTEGAPQFTPRTPYDYMLPEELKDIKNYPFMLDYHTPFQAIFRVESEQGDRRVTLRGVVPKGFCYNLADIPFLCQLISYDKHSPFVKDASFIHDYLIDRKKELYKHWDLENKDISPADFRLMTSLIFCHQLKKNAVPYNKAHIMAFFVNMWQTLLPSWQSLNKTETALC